MSLAEDLADLLEDTENDGAVPPWVTDRLRDIVRQCPTDPAPAFPPEELEETKPDVRVG